MRSWAVVPHQFAPIKFDDGLVVQPDFRANCFSSCVLGDPDGNTERIHSGFCSGNDQRPRQCRWFRGTLRIWLPDHSNRVSVVRFYCPDVLCYWKRGAYAFHACDSTSALLMLHVPGGSMASPGDP